MVQYNRFTPKTITDYKEGDCMKKVLVAAVMAVLMLGFIGTKTAYASGFDADFYAKKYPDVVASYGNDPGALFEHYMEYGIFEGRFQNAQEEASGTAVGMAGATYIDIDIDNQTVIYYQEGVPVLSTSCVTGNTSQGNDTPKGFFHIETKVPGKYLVGPTWNVWADRWMRFTGNVGLHDASWRSKFGGEIYTTTGSHGCVNLPCDVAKTLYDMVDVGTAVFVH